MTPAGMTKEQALEAARALWGDRADTCVLMRSHFVGVQKSRHEWDWRGHGLTWETAIEDAKANESGRKAKGADLKERFSRIPVRIDGDVIVREWHGVEHVVTRVGDGFQWGGAKFSSLTAVAKAITGAKTISGPRFFGLDEKAKVTR